jgi:diaminopimelate decarboxylase
MMKVDNLVEMTPQVAIRDNALSIAGATAKSLTERFGSPLYLYIEKVIRKSCRRLKSAIEFAGISMYYSAKANSNITLLKIICDEGFGMDAVSPAEIVIGLKAGLSPRQILFTCNNVSVEEFEFAVKYGIDVSVNSTGQLELFGQHFPGSRVAIRINPGFGTGHHQKVVTGGKKTKFGVGQNQMEEIMEIARNHRLHICGVTTHIGSNFFDYASYLATAEVLFGMAERLPEIEFINFGGGLGISYRDSGIRFDLAGLGEALKRLCVGFTKRYGRQLRFIMEPGRYLVAESGILLTTVTDLKSTSRRSFIGTDAGFNVFMRPTLYNDYHEIINCNYVKGEREPFDICGNICETGDLLAYDALMPTTATGDTLAVMDVGAYGYAMASNYNCRPRPAEILLKEDGTFRQIRKRDRLEDMLMNQVVA